MNKNIQEISRSWQRMLSGRRLNLIDPSPLDIEIEDIAKGISRIARWNGQTIGENPLSVAQHSVIVSEIFEQTNIKIQGNWILTALLHDAAEYIISDMITPLKSLLGNEYSNIERKIQDSIHIRFSLPTNIPNSISKAIKKADRQTAYLEATQLAGFTDKEARQIFKTPKNIPDYSIIPISANNSEKLFLEKFETIRSITNE